MNSRLKYQLLLHLTVLLWGFTGIIGKLIELPSTLIVVYRMFLACLSLLLYAVFRKYSLQVSFKQLLQYLGVGCVVALHWIFFFEAIHVSTVSVALATLSSATLFTALLEPLFFKKRIVGYELLFGVLIVVGLYLIFNYETQYLWGIIFSLISAFCASLFTTLNSKLLLKYKKRAEVMSTYEMLGGFSSIGVYLWLFDPQQFEIMPSISDSIYILILAIACTAFAFVVSIEVMKELTPFTVTLSINMEPVYSILFALFIFGDDERMSVGFYVGALIILGTILINAILKKRMKVAEKKRLKTEPLS
tara:strand:- start:1360 stop:2274 length:915 start_codon:yes stop_codon:yes gene_type:complete